jgi:hypothetical protein
MHMDVRLVRYLRIGLRVSVNSFLSSAVLLTALLAGCGGGGRDSSAGYDGSYMSKREALGAYANGRCPKPAGKTSAPATPCVLVTESDPAFAYLSSAQK